MRYTLKHAAMLALGLTLGIGAMAFTDILHPISPYIPSSLVLDVDTTLPNTMQWVDQSYGFSTKNPTGLLEVRWFCLYEGMNGLETKTVNHDLFDPVVAMERPNPPAGADEEAFYFELTRVHTKPCPVFRLSEQYPKP